MLGPYGKARGRRAGYRVHERRAHMKNQTFMARGERFGISVDGRWQCGEMGAR